MRNHFGLTGKVGFITGAGRGIGRAIALAYADAGADLILCSRTLKEVESVCQEVRARGTRALALELDVTRTEQIKAVVDTAVAELGRIDVLVNNAGTGFYKPTLEVTEREWDTVANTNVKGAFFVMQQVAQSMISRNVQGRIINISSIASIRVLRPGGAAYGASKAALNMLTKALAVEWAEKSITVNAIAPNLVRTSLTERSFADPAKLAPFLERTPLRRFPEPEDIATAAIFLASDAARNVTGEVLIIDGGRTVLG